MLGSFRLRACDCCHDCPGWGRPKAHRVARCGGCITVSGMTRPVEGRHGEPPRGFRLRQGYAGQDGGQVCARRPTLFAVPSASLALQASPATPAALPSVFCKLLTIPIRRVHQVPFIPHRPLFIPRFPPVFPQVTPFRVHEIRLRMDASSTEQKLPQPRVERREARGEAGGCHWATALRSRPSRLSSCASRSLPFLHRFQAGDRWRGHSCESWYPCRDSPNGA